MDGRRTSPPFKGRIYAAFKGPSVAYARGFAALRGRLRNAKIPRPGDRGPPGLDLDIATFSLSKQNQTKHKNETADNQNRFVPFCSVLFRSFPFRSVPFRFVSFRFVSFRFVSFRFVYFEGTADLV